MNLRRTLSFSLVSLVIAGAPSAQAFVHRDHQYITEAAFNSLKQCGLLSGAMDDETRALLVKYNLAQDNYGSISNVISKWFKYSHFYSPIRPLTKVGFNGIRANSDSALADYTQAVYNNVAAGSAHREISLDTLDYAGRIIHHVQDTSSPLHAIGINHGMSDGFEQKFFVDTATIDALQVNCRALEKLKPMSPLEVLRASAMTTLKRVDLPFRYTRDGEETKATWSEKFFTNAQLFTKFVSAYLRVFNPATPDFNFDTKENFPAGWAKQGLTEGAYGKFAKNRPGVMSADNFGRSDFIAQDGMVNARIHIEQAEYVTLKRDLMIQSIRSTQQVMLWLNRATTGQLTLNDKP